MILLMTALGFLIWFGVYQYRRRRLYELAALIPGPLDKPIVGTAYKFMGNTENIMASLQELSYESMKNNGLIRAWLGHILYFIMTDPADLEFVLKHCLEKDDLHRFMREIIGYGGIFAPVSIWRRRRKVLVPAFTPKIVENFVEVFSEQSEKLASTLETRHNTGKFSIWPYLTSYALDSVGETVMGVKINSQDNPNTPFLISLGKILNLICMRIFHLWLQPNWLFKLFPYCKAINECRNIMHSFTDKVIKDKRMELASEKECQTEADHRYDMRSYEKQTFLDLLITLSGGEKGYTDVELREEVLTLTIAGTDTSANAIGYTLLLLAKYPEVQDKVYQEIMDVFGKSTRPLVKEDLLKLSYLERVIKESLRLFPPVPFIIRKVLEEVTLPSGRILPAGSGVACTIWGVHRDPKYWGPEAEKFDPDRFSSERFQLQYPCNFMPFSNGPRNCVGYQYALMSMKTTIATLLRKHRIVPESETSSTPQIRVKLDIMMKDVNGYQIVLERRKVDA